MIAARRVARLAFLLAAFGLALESAAVGAGSRPPVAAENGMVVSSQRLASEVGVAVLRDGGNAIDAAVAVGYALAVVDPCCGNIGGGGFATIRLADGTTTFFNFRETAPAKARPDMFLDDKGEPVKDLSVLGYLAVGVPGTVLGLEAMRETYGTLSREALLAPAIRLAREGFVLSEGDAANFAGSAEALAREPNVAAIFFRDGAPLKAGERLVQTDLATTLETISDGGPGAFYAGPIAAKIVAASNANGGILSRRDFADFTVRETAPLTCDYRGYDIISAPPPSSGGTTICEILNIVEGWPIGEAGFGSTRAIHLLAEAMRHGFVDRNVLLGDPDFAPNPVERLVSDDYAATLRAAIDPDRAGRSEDVQPGAPPHESMQTTHYSVVDKDGNAVSVTYTINGWFGAKVIAGDTGFFLNNEMDDFTIRPGTPNMFGLVQGAKNAIAPGKRPLSSMSPTIVTRDGALFMVTGSPGGPRIISTTLATIMNVVDFGMDVQAAVDAPRIHHQWLPDRILAEPTALSPDVRAALEAMGHTVAEGDPWGAAAAILVGPGGPADGGTLYGAADPRRPAGAAVGY
ncbi:MAG: gamma-glutamyltransferase [Bauldia sp.]|nr:gamma-glutamyltransferase [Bauldia sp.]